MLHRKLSSPSGHFEEKVNVFPLKSNRGFSDVGFVVC